MMDFTEIYEVLLEVAKRAEKAMPLRFTVKNVAPDEFLLTDRTTCEANYYYKTVHPETYKLYQKRGMEILGRNNRMKATEMADMVITLEALIAEAGGDKWNRRFLELAKHVSDYSKDPSTKVGAVVVDDDGNVRTVAYNGFPRGVEDSEERLNNRELKYQFVVHSELNAISTCARIGIPTKGATLVCTHFPCSVCAGAIVQAGFKEVVVFAPNEDFTSRWSDKNEIASIIFTEGGVDVIVIPDKEEK
jgi:dCMP deaminase